MLLLRCDRCVLCYDQCWGCDRSGFGILMFHGRTGGKARQKVVRGKHVSGKVRYGREEGLARPHVPQIANREQMRMQSCSCYFFISQKRK